VKAFCRSKKKKEITILRDKKNTTHKPDKTEGKFSGKKRRLKSREETKEESRQPVGEHRGLGQERKRVDLRVIKESSCQGSVWASSAKKRKERQAVRVKKTKT